METIGIFGGSFNPPHLGHTALASAVVEAGMADEVWMVLSPLNPPVIRPADPAQLREFILRQAAPLSVSAQDAAQSGVYVIWPHIPHLGKYDSTAPDKTPYITLHFLEYLVE